jgi:hypothetical protein
MTPSASGCGLRSTAPGRTRRSASLRSLETLENRRIPALGATLVAETAPGPDGSGPSALVNVVGTLFFSADGPVFGRGATARGRRL